MKISINYDLVSKAREAKTNFSLKKSIKDSLIISCHINALITLMDPNFDSSPIGIRNKFIFALVIAPTLLTCTDRLFLAKYKNNTAIEDLKELSKKLHNINVHTDCELLQNIENYYTEYELVQSDDSIIPKITQNKYILVPAYQNGEGTEISLIQEHILGTTDYSLAHGEPKRVLKLSKKTA